jgi:hypothetical protein
MMSRPGAVAGEDLVAREGTLEGAIQWGETEGDEPLLLHAITLLLAPLRIGVEEVSDPTLRLHSLRLPVSSWAQLDGQAYELGSVVREITSDGRSYPVYDAYGSLNLGDAYHEVLPRRLRFGSREGCVLSLQLEGRLRATDTPPSFAPVDFAVAADVQVGPLHVIGDSGGDDYPSPADAAELAARLLDLKAYEAPVVHDDCTLLRPRCSA